MRKKKRNKKVRYLFFILILTLFSFGAVWLYPRARLIIENSWSGEEQFSIVLEAKESDALILTLTPAKSTVVVSRIPAKTMIDTPWFGEYQVEKLPLLADQENEKDVYNRSLSYYFGIPIDLAVLNSGLSLDRQNKSFLKGNLGRFFWPPKGITFWRIWRYLLKKDLVWQFFEFEELAEEYHLIDGTEVLKIDPARINRQLGEYFSDPVVKNENLTLSIFNAGRKEGIAGKISVLAGNLGLRVIEVGDTEEKIDGCLIFAAEKEIISSKSVIRLSRVLGCEIKQEDVNGIGEIKLLIENVKI